MKKIAAAVLALSVLTPALAQDRQFLPKPDVEALATDKKWIHIRVMDQDKVVWDIRSGGAFYGNNLSKNNSDSGTWLVTDQGQLCVKWRGRSQDRCVAILAEGEKFKMVDANDLKGTYAELTVE
ncbi:hypothetical protein [Candidatus Accumulibacter sp. ACC007]|uniref:hypothetical protein n=1 Tax=Candidatus Accumulibacter sp. ACC007 TaxID=2823333 RepID=UPI0025BACA65|nr:hypothetical protein [Candidatus Accumulibacter sp. ACC007]